MPMNGSRRTRNTRSLIGIAVLVALAIVIWLVRGRESEKRSSTPASSDAMAGMPGMTQTDSGEVSLTSGQVSQFGITFDTAKVRTLSSEVRAAGVVAFDETRVFQISPKFTGYVDRLYVNATGQPVARGQAVAAIFSPELVAAQTELLVASRLDRSASHVSVPGAAAANPDLLGAARQRMRLWDKSDRQIDDVLRSGKPQRTVTLFSPASGIVVEKNVVQGQAVTAGMSLMTVADLSTVWVTAELRESESGSVSQGSQATVELAAFPGQLLEGRVSYIYPTLQPEARTIKARIVLSNPGGRIKPGMYATVRIRTPMANALTVPSSAVIQTGERSYVFVKVSAQKLIPRDVQIGRRGSEMVEILSGLKTGEIVVTSAQFLLDSESNLGDVMRSMIGQGVSTDKGADMKGMNMPSATKR
jgi:multidrug efflux pump subunit AcrA (membrane-fusion protein)